MDNLIHTMRDIAFQFAKVQYDNYLQEHNLTKIPVAEIKHVVDEMWTRDKKKQLSDITRKILKGHFKEKYSSVAVENVLIDMFDDETSSKQRIILEIENYQEE